MGVVTGVGIVMRVMVRVAAKPGGAEARGAARRAGTRAIIKLRKAMMGEVIAMMRKRRRSYNVSMSEVSMMETGLGGTPELCFEVVDNHMNHT